MTRRWQSYIPPEIDPLQGQLLDVQNEVRVEPFDNVVVPEAQAVQEPKSVTISGNSEDYLEIALTESLASNRLHGLSRSFAGKGAATADLAKRYGEASIDHVAGAEFKAGSSHSRARDAFAKFVLTSETIDTTGLNEEETEALVLGMFVRFRNRYVGPHNKQHRSNLREFINQARSARQSGFPDTPSYPIRDKDETTYATIDPEATESLASNIDEKISLLSALQPNYLGLQPAEYTLDKITDVMVDHVGIPHLKRSLVGTGVELGKDSLAMGYKSEDGKHHTVALTPEEYSILPNWLNALGRSAYSKTLRSRPGTTDIDVAAARRAAGHSVETKRVKTKQYLDNALVPQADLINLFIDQAKHPETETMSQTEMRANMALLQTTVLDNMFMAIREQRGWTKEQYDLVVMSVEKRLFMLNDHNRNITYFRNLLQLAAFYNREKQGLFLARLAEAQAYSETHAS